MNMYKTSNRSYGFGSYDVGEIREYAVSAKYFKEDHSSIRTSASLMGTRRGWTFKTERIDIGTESVIQVTRVK